MNFILIATRGYEYLGDRIHAEILYGSGRPLHECIDTERALERKVFGDGETYHRYKADVRGNRVIIVGGTRTDSEFMELYDLAWYACKAGAADIRLYIPYFGYSTMERAVKPGEIVKAKVRAQILSSLPCSQRLTVVMTDLHAAGMEQYFEGSVHTIHHYAKHPVLRRCKELKCDVIASTDAGRAKWVESLANDIGVDSAFITKRRLSGSETEVAGVSADVTGKAVAVYDDMCRSGSSLRNAAATYWKMGAREVHAVFTHPVLPGDSLAGLLNCARPGQNLPMFDSISFCNTLPVDVPGWAPHGMVRLMDVVDNTLIQYLTA